MPEPTPTPAAATPAVRFRIGVDGGGTHTRVRLCDGTGRPLGEGRAGPSALGQGVEQAWRHIHEAVALARAQAGAAAQGFEWAAAALGLGLSGTGQRTLVDAFLAQAPHCAQLVLESDGWTGLLGAHGGRPGGLLIAGTGSICMALDAQGQRHRVGGWGWVHGDEGSGAWFGLQALRLAQRALDGRGPRGALAQAVLAEVGADLDTLLDWQRQAGQAGHAALAPLVFAHEADDPAAAALLAQGVEELHALVQAADPAGRLPFVLAGSVAQRLAPRLRAARPGPWTDACGDALAGALQLLDATPEVTA